MRLYIITFYIFDIYHYQQLLLRLPIIYQPIRISLDSKAEYVKN